MGLGEKAKEAASQHVRRKAARDILNGIGEWRGNRVGTAKQRWIYELIQNAVDTARERENNMLAIEIKSDENSVKFKHNGGHFTLDEINAVIYGGSTKPYTPESEYLGRFGTGLLVTHIVSRSFKLKGSICDDEGIHHFKLAISREGGDETAIVQSIDDCYSQLEKATQLDATSMGYWTEFTYFADGSVGSDAIREGIDQLKANMPSIFAFNDIDRITINGESFQKILKKGQHWECVIVGKNKLYNMRDKEHEVQVGVLVENGRVSELANKPKIFVGMPLIETSDYVTLPFQINSLKFRPTKERDGLSSDDEGKERNEMLLQSSLELYFALLSSITKERGLKELFNLVKVRLIPENRCSQNPLWEQFNGLVLETFGQVMQECPMVNTSSGSDGVKEITNSCFPVKRLGDAHMDGKRFDLFYKLVAEIKTNIPPNRERDSWMGIAEQLSEIFPEHIHLYGLYDMRKDLQDFVGTRRPTFSDLQDEFQVKDARGFLSKFYQLADSLYRKRLISYDFIDQLLPTQDMRISPVKWVQDQESRHLYLEDARRNHIIPEDLKNIAAKIGRDVRPDLVDNGFSRCRIVRKCVQDSMNIAKVLSDLLDKHALKSNEEIRDWGDNRVLGWMGLFRWCITNRRLKPGFPVIAKDGKVQVLNELNRETFVIPFKYMQDMEGFEELYPRNRVLHDKYFNTAGTQLRRFLHALRDYAAFVTNLPCYEKTAEFRHKELESVLRDKVKLSRGRHRVKATKPMIAVLPFWDDVRHRIEERPNYARLLLRFIIECIMDKDKSWEHYTRLVCSCKSGWHYVLPCHWLANLRTDKWVCRAEKNEQGEQVVSCMAASRESIERLFDGTEFSDLLLTYPNKLMALLPYLGFDDLDLKVKLQSIETGESEEEVRRNVSQLVDIAYAVPDLVNIAKRNLPAFKDQLQKLKQRLEQEPIKDQNRIIGKNVERIIKMIIEETEFADMQFRAETIYRGGDLEMWPVVTDGYDCGEVEISDTLGQKYTLEIKFTSGTRAHMSKAQSEVARDKTGRAYYIVLVVHDNGTLRQRLIVDPEKEAIPKDVVSDVKQNSHIITNIYSKLGSLPNPEEIEPDINGYWIKKRVWEDKCNVFRWLETEFGNTP